VKAHARVEVNGWLKIAAVPRNWPISGLAASLRKDGNMGRHPDRHERKLRGIALKAQFKEIGLSPSAVARRSGWSQSYLSRAWNSAEPSVAPSAEMLSTMEDVLRERKRELSEIVEDQHAAITLVDTCNGAMAKLCEETRVELAKRLRSRLFSPASGAAAAHMLPEQVAGAMFRVDDGWPNTAMYVLVVRAGQEAEELASVAHELQDLSREYAFKARRLRRATGRPLNRPLPRAEY
jgi:transcriptional regulator with XRE-family HTH domain